MTQSSVFVINPKSHKVNMNGSALARVAADFEDVPVIYFDGGAPLSETLIPLLRQGRNTVYVEGGDGTVVAALTASFEYASSGGQLPRIAVLPGGSTNLAHKVLGLNNVGADTLKEQLSKVANRQIRQKSETHRALLIETSETKSPLVGFLLSTGSLARLMLYTQQHLHGTRRGGVSIARAILQLSLFPQSTKYSDDLPVIRPSQFTNLSTPSAGGCSEQTFSVFSTFTELSLGLNPFWDRGNHPIGHTQADWPIRRMRTGIARAILGKSSKGLARHGLTSHGCSEMVFQCDGPVVLDGEELVMPADRVFKVSASPPLEFLR